jgi:hypothetical protein
MREQSRLSREFFDAEVTANSADGVKLDPATLPVEFAFVDIGAEPTGSDWHTATLQHGDVFGVLVGPGALELPANDYDVWQHITDTPEEPRAPFGKLRIY